MKSIYFVYSEFVKVSTQGGTEKELILRFARPGDILGIRGLGGKSVYPIFATAVTASKVCYIQNDFPEATLKTNTSFTDQLLHVYAAAPAIM